MEYPEKFIIRLLEYIREGLFNVSIFSKTGWIKFGQSWSDKTEACTLDEIYWFYLFEKQAFKL